MGRNEIDRSEITSKDQKKRKKALKTHTKKIKKNKKKPTAFGGKTFSLVNQNIVSNGKKPKTEDFLILHSSVEGNKI